MKLNNGTTIAISRRNKQKLMKIKRLDKQSHNANDVITFLLQIAECMSNDIETHEEPLYFNENTIKYKVPKCKKFGGE